MYIHGMIQNIDSEIENLPKKTKAWNVELIEADEKRHLNTTFYTDKTYEESPTINNVLEHMIRDSASVANHINIESWLSSLKDNIHSMKDVDLFEALLQEAKYLRKFLGDTEFETLVKDPEIYIKDILPKVIFDKPRSRGRPKKQIG